MGSTQQFSLRWNNYLNHITGAFDSLRTDEDLVDVTLSCEGKRIRAHKMLLSACSSYFRDLFKENPCQHPVIIFRNVKYEDLVSLVDFMYQGEVNVEQEQLTSFLTTAELLAVQGLSEGGGKKTNPSNDKEIDLCDSPDESEDPPVQLNNSNHRSELKAPSSEISSAVSFFPLQQSNTPPSKRRKWSNSSGLAGTPKSSAHSVKISEKDCDLERRHISKEQPPLSPQGDIEVLPALKVELPEYIEEDTVEQDVSYTDSSQDQSGQSGLRTSVDPLPNVSQLLPSLNSSSDTKAELDTYCSNSGEAVLAVGDSVSGADLSQILSKAGPSNENQNQDTLQGTNWRQQKWMTDSSNAHHLVKSPVHGRVCHLCKIKHRVTSKGSLRQTRFQCLECNISLCRNNCFLEFHQESNIQAIDITKNHYYDSLSIAK